MGIIDKLFGKKEKKFVWTKKEKEEYAKGLASSGVNFLARETRDAKELGDNERLRLILEEVEKRGIPPTLWTREVEKKYG